MASSSVFLLSRSSGFVRPVDPCPQFVERVVNRLVCEHETDVKVCRAGRGERRDAVQYPFRGLPVYDGDAGRGREDDRLEGMELRFDLLQVFRASLDSLRQVAAPAPNGDSRASPVAVCAGNIRPYISNRARRCYAFHTEIRPDEEPFQPTMPVVAPQQQFAKFRLFAQFFAFV